MRRYYLIENFETKKTTVLLKQDFNLNYKWHSFIGKKLIKNLLQDFKNKKAKVINVF